MQSTFQYEQPYAHLIHVWQELAAQMGNVDGDEFFVLEAKPEYSYRMNIRREQQATFNPHDWEKIYRTHAWLSILTPMNYALFHGTKLMMLASVLPVAEEVGEISFLTDENMITASIAVKRGLMQLFKQALSEIPFPRLQAKVDAEFLIGRKFVERLGFEKEGVLRKFGPTKHDYIMYGLIKE